MAARTLYAVCPMDHWGDVAAETDILTNDLQCACGRRMEPKQRDPLTLGWRAEDKVEVQVVPRSEADLARMHEQRARRARRRG